LIAYFFKIFFGTYKDSSVVYQLMREMGITVLAKVNDQEYCTFEAPA